MLSTSDWNKSVKAAERLLQAKSSRTQLRIDAASPRSWYDLRRRVDKGKITVACFLCLEALARSYSQACLQRAKGLGASVHSPRICMQPAPAWQLEQERVQFMLAVRPMPDRLESETCICFNAARSWTKTPTTDVYTRAPE